MFFLGKPLNFYYNGKKEYVSHELVFVKIFVISTRLARVE